MVCVVCLFVCLWKYNAPLAKRKRIDVSYTDFALTGYRLFFLRTRPRMVIIWAAHLLFFKIIDWSSVYISDFYHVILRPHSPHHRNACNLYNSSWVKGLGLEANCSPLSGAGDKNGYSCASSIPHAVCDYIKNIYFKKLLETQFVNPPMSFSLLDPNLLITNLL